MMIVVTVIKMMSVLVQKGKSLYDFLDRRKWKRKVE